MVGKFTKSLTSRNRVRATVLLKIRHGTNLFIRWLDWMINEKPIPNAILSRRILATLEIHNRLLLAAASDRFNGLVDMPPLTAASSGYAQPEGQRSAGTIQSLLQDRYFALGSSFHIQCESKDNVDDCVIYVDLGEDNPDNLECALQDRVKQTSDNGMSEAGCKKLTNPLQSYKYIFD